MVSTQRMFTAPCGTVAEAAILLMDSAQGTELRARPGRLGSTAVMEHLSREWMFNVFLPPTLKHCNFLSEVKSIVMRTKRADDFKLHKDGSLLEILELNHLDLTPCVHKTCEHDRFFFLKTRSHHVALAGLEQRSACLYFPLGLKVCTTIAAHNRRL